MRVSRLAAVAMVAMMTLGTASCAKSAKSSATTAGSATTTAGASSSASPGTITIHNFMYQPNPAHVKVGEAVTVTNEDGTNHSLTADNGAFTTGVFSSGSKTLIINKPGTYTFHCQIHNFMTGSIIVSS
jgi:plastocyanin